MSVEAPKVVVKVDQRTNLDLFYPLPWLVGKVTSGAISRSWPPKIGRHAAPPTNLNINQHGPGRSFNYIKNTRDSLTGKEHNLIGYGEATGKG